MQRKYCGWLIALCLLLRAGAMAHAQSSSTGEIRGTVTDPSGAIVPNAVVSVVNVNTGEKKEFTTNGNGIYDTVSTPNGQYKVTITAPGFEQLVLGPITLDVGVITLNGKLKIGSNQQQVVVTADTAALLNTESGEQSTTFDEKPCCSCRKLATIGRTSRSCCRAARVPLRQTGSQILDSGYR
jgi:hypothetical protein